MEQFLTFLFYFILGIYLLRLGFTYLLPWLLRRWIKRMARHMEQQQQYHQNQTSDFNPPQKNKSGKLDDVGEYVDFEEIKDDKP
ncbi:MAG: DUF4834 domain-containing protein [Bacteroidetes bacterium]|nr:DUF4834 domain-containing protein [Bacteroidota bacterium]